VHPFQLCGEVQAFCVWPAKHNVRFAHMFVGDVFGVWLPDLEAGRFLAQQL
jgi:hypothetical protein